MAPLVYPQQSPQDPDRALPDLIRLRRGRLYLDDLLIVIGALQRHADKVEVYADAALATKPEEDLRSASALELRRIRIIATNDTDPQAAAQSVLTLAEGKGAPLDAMANSSLKLFAALTQQLGPTYTVDLGAGVVRAHTLPARRHIREIAAQIDARSRRWWSGFPSAQGAPWDHIATTFTGVAAAFLVVSVVLGWLLDGPNNWPGVVIFVGFIALIVVLFAQWASDALGVRTSRVPVSPILRREGREGLRTTRREVGAALAGAVVGAIAAYLAAGK